jgi:hypothetical protein
MMNAIKTIAALAPTAAMSLLLGDTGLFVPDTAGPMIPGTMIQKGEER